MWIPVRDPHEAGSPPCNVTEATAVFDQRVAVGYYETGTSAPCTRHAFEFYSTTPNGSLTAPYTYVDLTPTAPTTLDVSAVASGINILGDVVGTITWNTADGKSHAGGWIYRNLKYTTFCYTSATTLIANSCSSASALSTYANGLNFSDVVVGNFTSSTGYQNGFAIVNPWKTPTTSTKYSTFAVITTTAANTILSSINQATGMTQNQKEFFAGWMTPAGSNPVSAGLVGVCRVTHCGSKG
jgi:hypothetical protein